MNRVKIVGYIGITAFTTLLLTLLFQSCGNSLVMDRGHLHISVVDAYSLSPLSGATVILPEFDMQEISDTNGNVWFFKVPCAKNKQLDKLLPSNFAQTTVLCYQEGYCPYAIFYVQLEAGRMREELTLYMFPESENAGCLIEAPPEEWVEELLDKYDPQKR